MSKERKTCCFFGHRKIAEADSLKIKVYNLITALYISKTAIYHPEERTADKFCLIINQNPERVLLINMLFRKTEKLSMLQKKYKIIT